MTRGRWRRAAFDLVFYGHVWIALGAAALCRLTQQLTAQPAAAPGLPLLVGSATLGVYTLHRYLSFSRANGRPDSRRYRIVARHPRTSLVVGTTALLLAAPPLLMLARPGWWPLLPAVPLTFWYLTPLWPGGPRLRDLPYLKVVWVGLAWALVTALLPALAVPDAAPTERAAILTTLGTGGFTTAVALLFDFRDTALDRAQGVRTVANRAPALARALAVAGLTGGLLCWWPLVNERAGLLAGWLVGLAVAALTTPDRSEDWYAVVVNGLLVLWPVLIWLGDR